MIIWYGISNFPAARPTGQPAIFFAFANHSTWTTNNQHLYGGTTMTASAGESLKQEITSAFKDVGLSKIDANTLSQCTLVGNCGCSSDWCNDMTVSPYITLINTTLLPLHLTSHRRCLCGSYAIDTHTSGRMLGRRQYFPRLQFLE